MIRNRHSSGQGTQRWIEEAFLSRELPAPGKDTMEEWISRSSTEELLLEAVYLHLRRAKVLRALQAMGIETERISESHLTAVVSRASGGIVDFDSAKVLDNMREALSELLFEEIGLEQDSVVRFTILSQVPWNLYAIALSGQPLGDKPTSARKDRLLALGMERMMGLHGYRLPRKDLLEEFKTVRGLMREEKKRLKLEAAKERQREQHFHAWVRSLWTDREVRRELGLRPSEFEEWVKRGRIPVVLRIETIRNGKIREKRLFDPEAVLKISPATIERWRRRLRSRSGQEIRRPSGGRSRTRGDDGREQGRTPR